MVEVPTSFWFFISLTTIASLALVQTSIVRRDPALALTALMLLMYFGFGGLIFPVQMQDYFRMFTVGEPSIVLAGFYSLVVVLAVAVGYFIPQQARRSESGIDLT